MGDNLEHLQDNMRLTTNINSSQTRMGNLEHQLEVLGELFLTAIRQSLSEQGMLDVGGDNKDNQDGGEDRGDTGVSLSGNMRLQTLEPLIPAPRERGLIE